MLPLCHGELDAESDDVTDNDLRQHSQQSVPETGPELWSLADGQKVLIAHVVHTEQEAGNQRNHHKRHDALRVDGIMDVDTAHFRCLVRHEHERLEAVEDRAESMQFTVFLKSRLYLVKKIS